MLCPNCHELVELDSWVEGLSFRCEHCREWLQMTVRDAAVEGVVRKSLVIVTAHDDRPLVD